MFHIINNKIKKKYLLIFILRTSLPNTLYNHKSNLKEKKNIFFSVAERSSFTTERSSFMTKNLEKTKKIKKSKLTEKHFNLKTCGLLMSENLYFFLFRKIFFYNTPERKRKSRIKVLNFPFFS